MTVMIIKAMVMAIIVVVVFVIAPFFAAVIIAMHRVIRLRHLGNVLLKALIGLLSIGVLVGHLEHLSDHR
jgi:hypothetical protein